MKLKFIFLGMVLGSSLLQAQELGIGQLGHGGSGCLKDETSVTLDSSSLLLKIIPTNYKLLAKKKSMARKSCMVAIPLTVPAGKKLVVVKSRQVGEVLLAHKKAQAATSLEVFFSGGKGPVKRSHLTGPLGQALNREDDIGLSAGCGESVLLRMNQSLIVSNPHKKATPASGSIEEISIQLAVENCE